MILYPLWIIALLWMVSSSLIQRRARYVSRMRRPTGIQEVAGSIFGSGTISRRDWSWNNVYGHSLRTADSTRTIVSYWRKYGHLVLVNRLRRLPRNSVYRLTGRARNVLNSFEEPYNNKRINQIFNSGSFLQNKCNKINISSNTIQGTA